MSHLPVVTPRQMIRVVEKLGFLERRQTGSHRIFRHPSSGKIVPIPIHRGDLKSGTVRSILRQANLTSPELMQLLKQ